MTDRTALKKKKKQQREKKLPLLNLLLLSTKDFIRAFDGATTMPAATINVSTLEHVITVSESYHKDATVECWLAAFLKWIKPPQLLQTMHQTSSSLKLGTTNAAKSLYCAQVVDS